MTWKGLYPMLSLSKTVYQNCLPKRNFSNKESYETSRV
ncbi:hypothetical protein RintRC_2750 [Richelia intracellularis]|nr:hypothetical protein RintRC_2750 [Richelia intracellularis]